MFAEHQVVETDMDIYRDGHYIPEDTSGTVVNVRGDKYFVEFPTIKNNPVIECSEHELGEIVNE